MFRTKLDEVFRTSQDKKRSSDFVRYKRSFESKSKDDVTISFDSSSSYRADYESCSLIEQRSGLCGAVSDIMKTICPDGLVSGPRNVGWMFRWSRALSGSTIRLARPVRGTFTSCRRASTIAPAPGLLRSTGRGMPAGLSREAKLESASQQSTAPTVCSLCSLECRFESLTSLALRVRP